MKDFFCWVESRSGEKPINEYSFIDLPQQEGDFVFFGIHLLNRLYNEMGQFPFLSLEQNPQRTNISKHVTRIIEQDPVRRTIIVAPEISPYALGYRSRSINKTDRQGKIHIPSKQLEDVTFLLPKMQTFNKLWVVISNNYQRSLAQSLRKREIEIRKNQINF